ncbi:hypothetical protein O2K51_09095 [Apibacter raozihei]|uniref:hypothetical protein n=1 Tax=Apibacter raozihei TaxID=2500547 RepID=UPI000FE2C17F|nr:hypothetical protein [Apibacter raozihei]
MFKKNTITKNTVIKNIVSQKKQFGFYWSVFTIICFIIFLISILITDKSPISIFTYNSHTTCSNECPVKNKNEKSVFVSNSSNEQVNIYIFNEEIKKRKEFRFDNSNYYSKVKLKRFNKIDWNTCIFRPIPNTNKLYAYNPRLTGSVFSINNCHLLGAISFQNYKFSFLYLQLTKAAKCIHQIESECTFYINHKLRGPPGILVTNL